MSAEIDRIQEIGFKILGVFQEYRATPNEYLDVLTGLLKCALAARAIAEGLEAQQERNEA